MRDGPSLRAGRPAGGPGRPPTASPLAEAGSAPWPNLFVVGAQKAGTTAVHEILGRHPDVWMAPVKEPCHFVPADPAGSRRGRAEPHRTVWATYRDPAAYLGLFRGGENRRWRGESSTLYLYDARAARGIAERCPEARIVVILREPVERAWSAWMFGRMRGWEPERDFRRALALEEERIAGGWPAPWHYRRRGMYAGQVARYLDLFGRARVFVRTFDLLRAEPERFFSDLFGFLGVAAPPGLDVRTERNRGALPRAYWLSRVLFARARVSPRTRLWVKGTPAGRLIAAGLRLVDRANLVRPPRLPPAAARDLQAAFVEDIRATERLTAEPLDGWLGRYREA